MNKKVIILKKLSRVLWLIATLF